MSTLQDVCAALADIAQRSSQVGEQLHGVGKRLQVNAARVQVELAQQSTRRSFQAVAHFLEAAAQECTQAAQLLEQAAQVGQRYIDIHCAGSTASIAKGPKQVDSSPNDSVEQRIMELRVEAMRAVLHESMARCPVPTRAMAFALMLNPAPVLSWIESISFSQHRPRPNARGRTLVRADDKAKVKIEIFPPLDQDEDPQAEVIGTLNHEVGHVAWRRILSDHDRDVWARLHIDALRERRQFFTVHSMSSAEEDFAESYCNFIAAPETLWETDQSKYTFLYEIINQLHAQEMASGAQRT